MPKSMSSKLRRGQKGSRRGRGSHMSNQARVRTESFIPNYSSVPTQVRKFRYQCSTSNSSLITRGDLLGLYAFLVSSTAWNSLFGGVRVTRVSIYSAGNSSSSGGFLGFTEVSLIWLSETSPENQITASGNADHPAVISSAPPPGTLCSFWSGTGYSGDEGTGDVMFQLVYNAGDIIDISIEYTPQVTATASGGSYTSGTSGTSAYGYLDGPGGRLVPVGNVQVYH
jgi:hypothetical protein